MHLDVTGDVRLTNPRAGQLLEMDIKSIRKDTETLLMGRTHLGGNGSCL